jgi:hypothetical protein
VVAQVYPVDEENANGAMTWPKMEQIFVECLRTAITASVEIPVAELTVIDPRAITAMADTLFIQRMKMGV